MKTLFARLFKEFLTLPLTGGLQVIKRAVLAFETIANKTFEVFAWVVVGRILLDLITSSTLTIPEQFKASLGKLVALQTGNQALADKVTSSTGFDTFAALAQGQGEFFMGGMLDLFTPEGPITPEIGMINAQKFVGLNVLVNVSAWLTKVMGDILSLGKFESLGGLPLQISWSLGLGWLTWVIMGPPLQMFIADPLVEGLNRKHFPYRLQLSQILDIFTEGWKDQEWFLDAMGGLGIDEEKALLLYEARRKKFTRQQGKRFFERGLIEKDQLREIIKKEGWTDQELDLIMKELLNERIFDLTEDIAKEAQTLFENGQISETSARTFLKNAHWQPEEIELALQLANMKKLRTDLTPSQMLNMMSERLFTQDQVLKRLKDRGFDDPDAQALIQYELITSGAGFPIVPPPPEKDLTQAQILNAYRNKIISEEDAEKRLIAQGLESEDVQILLDLNRPAETTVQ